MTVTHIVAVSENNVIGKDLKLPWHLPNDMKLFKNKTWGLPVVMGRKTFASLGMKALKGRLNIVVTRQDGLEAEDVEVVNSIEAALALCARENYKEVMIIGGGEMYVQTLAIASKLYITRVATTLEGDTFYPTLSENEWTLEFVEHFEKDERHAFDYRFETWVRHKDIV